MAFLPTSKEKLRRILGYPATAYYLGYLTEAMLQVETDSPAAVTTVESLIAEWEANRASITNNLSGAGLKKVDVLEWFEGGNSLGYSARQGEIYREIMLTMGLENFNAYYQSSSNLLRS